MFSICSPACFEFVFGLDGWGGMYVHLCSRILRIRTGTLPCSWFLRYSLMGGRFGLENRDDEIEGSKLGNLIPEREIRAGRAKKTKTSKPNEKTSPL